MYIIIAYSIVDSVTTSGHGILKPDNHEVVVLMSIILTVLLLVAVSCTMCICAGIILYKKFCKNHAHINTIEIKAMSVPQQDNHQDIDMKENETNFQRQQHHGAPSRTGNQHESKACYKVICFEGDILY